MSKGGVAVVIPVYNEQQTIPNLMQSLADTIAGLAGIIFVNDNSGDATKEIIEQYQLANDNIVLLNNNRRRGLAQSYIKGFDYALGENYNIIIQMDADGSHNPEDINKMLVAVADYDLVVGSRYLPDSKIFQFARSRYWASKIANIFLRIILGVPVRDITGGFKCFKAKTLAKINFSEILSWGHFFQAEINYRVFCNKGKISEIPIFFQGRKQGDSKVSLTTIIDFIWSLLLLLKQRFFAV